MMGEFYVDRGGRGTDLRFGDPFGFELSGTASDSGWYRLLPDGINATRSAEVVQLQNVRADVSGVNLYAWSIQFDIPRLTVPILSLDASGSLRLEYDVDIADTGLRYILVPGLVNELNVRFDGMGSLTLAYSTDYIRPGTVGYSREEVTGETASPTLKRLENLGSGESLELPYSDVSNVFYQFTDPDDDNKVSWGEVEIQ